jgi:hypothetical protein
MSLRIRGLAGVFAAALGLASQSVPLSAQSPGPNREVDSSASPYWMALAVGGGGTRLTCDICHPSRDLGPSATLTLGSTASSDLAVGVELGGWTHDEDEVRESVYRAGVIAYLNLLDGRGLYAIGGFGWSGYRADDYRYDAPRVSLGAGWDFPFVPGWVIGNQVILDASSMGSLRNDETTVARRVGLSTVRVVIQLRNR